MFKRLFGGNQFLKKMNTLMELYSRSHNAQATYKELKNLEPLIRTSGEEALYNLNRAALLYDMKRYRESADIVLEIKPLNPEFDARCASLKTKIMDDWQGGSNY